VRVRDNASTDRTAEVVAQSMATKGSCEIDFRKNSSNVGAYNNFHTLLSTIDTEFFCILSDDDLLLPDHLALGVTAMRRSNNCMAYVANVVHCTSTGRVLGLASSATCDAILDRGVAAEHFLKHGRPEWTGSIYRRELLERHGGIHPLGVYADVEFQFRCAALYPSIFAHKPGALYNHGDSRRRLYPFDWIWPALTQFEQQLDAWEDVDPGCTKRIQQHHRRQYLDGLPRMIVQYLASGAYQDAESAIEQYAANRGSASRATRAAKIVAATFNRRPTLGRITRATYQVWRTARLWQRSRFHHRYAELMRLPPDR